MGRGKLLYFVLPALTFLLTGCGLQTTATPNPVTTHITGNVHGGEQPVSGAHIHIMVASSLAYAGAATALPLTGAAGADAYGSYITSDSSGNFDLTGKYACVFSPDETYAYILATEGNPGLSNPSANNSAIALVAALGSCPNTATYASDIPFIVVNEASTVAAAYALAQFASGPGNVGTAAPPPAGPFPSASALDNAMTMAAAIVPAATGRSAGTVTSSTGGLNFATHYPQTKLNSLANITSACVNTDGTISGPTNATPCYQFFTAATPPLGTAPTDTFTALLNVAHNPGNNVAGLFNFGGGVGAAFQPTVAAQPNDWTLAVNYSILAPNYHITNVIATGIGAVFGVACGVGCDPSPSATLPDAFFGIGPAGQNAGAETVLPAKRLNAVQGVAFGFAGINPAFYWANNNADAPNAATVGAIDQVTSLVAFGSITDYPSTTYPSLGHFGGLAMDTLGSAWVASNTYGGLVNVNGLPTPTVTPGVSNGNLGLAGVAINGDGSIWVSCPGLVEGSGTACQYDATGTLVHSYPGLDTPQGVALDANNHAWFASNNTSTHTYKVFEVNTTNGISSGYTSPHLGQVQNLAIDSNGNAWVPSCNASCSLISTVSGDPDAVFVFAHEGALVSPMYGFIDDEGAANTDLGPNVFGLKAPVSAAVDESGNVWVANASYVLDDPGITIFIGAAGPVVTPIQRSLKAPYLAPAKRP